MKFNKYLPYFGSNGLSTKKWGPSAWTFLFSSIMGGYPPVIDLNNKEHVQIKKAYKEMFKGLAYTLPCSFCRYSYKQYFEEIPIDPFLNGRIELMKWLYIIRDRVNKKLISQEVELYERERVKLINQLAEKEISQKQYSRLLNSKKKEICITKESPPFSIVLKKYESLRA